MNKQEIAKTLMQAAREHGLVETLYRVFGKNINVKIGVKKRFYEASVDDLVLSVRSYNALRRVGVHTVGDIVDKLNLGEIKNVRNLGVKSYSEIQTKILVYAFWQLTEQEQIAFFSDLIANNVRK